MGISQSSLTLIPLILLPAILPKITSFLRKSKQPTPQQPPPPPLLFLPKAILALHTIYYLSQLLWPPYDLFVSNHLPILISNSILRDTLIPPELAGSELVSPLAELLLDRLKALDTRYIYARLGHVPLTQCLWCTHSTDYFLFALPGIMKPYIKSLFLLGVLTVPYVGGKGARRRRDAWLGVMVWLLSAGLAGELGVKWAWEVVAHDGDCTHVASAIHTLRSLVLLSLPIIYTLLPLPHLPFTPTPDSLVPYLASLQSTIQYTSITRKAIAQSPQLRAASGVLGKRESERSDIARRDRKVWDKAKECGVEEGKLREQVRGMVERGWKMLLGN